MTNCPNCAAPLTSNTCEYCGSVFYNYKSAHSLSSDYMSGVLTANEIRRLCSLNEIVESQISTTNLYTEALNAMRCYGGTL